VTPALRRLLPPVTGAAVLGFVLWRTGTGPVVAGLRALDARTLLLGVVLAFLTTVANAWRWQLVARGLRVGVALHTAVASYYRSQLLNATLPGGVLGDVHRGLHHGRSAGATGLALRAVAWERLAGQVVQAGLVLLGLALLPSPLRGYLPVVGLVLVAGCVAAWALWRAGRARVPAPPRLLRAVAADVRRGLLPRETWPGIVLASAVAVVGYVATYLLAARAVGVTASPERLVPLVLLVLLAAGLPVNLAGWGPREGMAAWSFGAAGLGAAHGVATSVAYGALMLVGTLPGVVVLLLGTRRPARPPEEPSPEVAAAVRAGEARG
jgi:glycosyltransferase 2 family protein